MKQHKKTLKALTAGIVAVAMLGTFVGCGSSSGGSTAAKGSSSSEGGSFKTASIEGGFLGQIDAWPSYYAINNGIADKYGIDMTMMFFDSGMPMIQTVPSNELTVMDTGSVPSLMAALRYDTPVIGIASNEGPANAIVCRPDNEAVNHKGASTEHPDILGNADDLRGKTILCTTVSSGHYMLFKYLNALGLSESDVTIKNLEQAQAISAFESGEGDYLVLWTPYLYRAFEKGWVELANGEEVGAANLMLWLGDPKTAKDDQDNVIARCLAMADEGVQKYQKDGKDLVPDIVDFFTDFAAMDISENDAGLDIDTHTLYTLEEQKEMIDSGELLAGMQDAAKFFESQNTLTADEVKQLEDKKYCIDGSFIDKAIEIRDSVNK